MIDLMCSDYKAAARNRRMVKLKQNIEAYLWIESVIRGWPHRKRLPYWVPQGDIPIIDKGEIQELHKYGIYEINNYDK